MVWICEHDKSSEKVCEALVSSVFGSLLFFFSVLVCIALVALCYTYFHPQNFRSKRQLLRDRKEDEEKEEELKLAFNGTPATWSRDENDFSPKVMPTISSLVSGKFPKNCESFGSYLQGIIDRDRPPKMLNVMTEFDYRLAGDSSELADTNEDEDVVFIDQNYWRQLPLHSVRNRTNFITAGKYRQITCLEDYLSSDSDFEEEVFTTEMEPDANNAGEMVKSSSQNNLNTASRDSPLHDSLRDSESQQISSDSISYNIETTKTIEIKENISFTGKPSRSDQPCLEILPGHQKDQIASSKFVAALKESPSKRSRNLKTRNEKINKAFEKPAQLEALASDFSQLQKKVVALPRPVMDVKGSLVKSESEIPSKRHKKKVMINPYPSRLESPQ